MSLALLVMSGIDPVPAQGGSVANPIHTFVGGFNPGNEDFFAHDSAHTFLVRMRFDADMDGRTDLALSETSVFGTGGGPWLLFRRQSREAYRYLGEFFAGPSAVTVARDAEGRGRLTVRSAVGAGVDHVVQYRVTASKLLKLASQDSARTEEGPRPGGPVVEWCALNAYRRAPKSCWRPGWPPS